MCLAIPSKITKIQNGIGTIDVDGVKRTTSLLLVEDAKVGDYVMVHVGAAISLIDEEEAKKTFDLLKQLGELHDLDDQNMI